MIVLILVLLVLVSAVLLIPFNISFTASKDKATYGGEVTVRWLGLRLLRRSIGGHKEKEKPPSRKRKARVNPVRIALLIRDAVPSFAILLRAVKRSISLHRLSVKVNFGLDDPADTAALAGYIWTLSWMLNRLPNASFSFAPEFGMERFGGSAAGDLGVRVLPLATGFLRAYAKKPFRAFIREMRR